MCYIVLPGHLDTSHDLTKLNGSNMFQLASPSLAGCPKPATQECKKSLGTTQKL